MSAADAIAENLAPATARSSYPLWTTDIIRYGDTDRQGHVNNAVFATFFESGRTRFFAACSPSLRTDDMEFVIVRLEIDFRAELFFPGSVDIGTRVLKIGRSSFRLGQALFSGKSCAAIGECVMVVLDAESRKAKPFSPALRRWLETGILVAAGAGPENT
ncbi:MAG TPA: thioesterase family protein [Stellaceae bacterium]|nr:thioesterase family protein [Stellaceae bacterium]